jgi:hypothetical protein
MLRTRSASLLLSSALMRLRGGKRWVPQDFEGSQRFEDEGHDFRKSNNGGLLAQNPETDAWTRVADNGEDPDFGVYNGNSVVDFIETRARKYYVVSKDDEHVYVQTDCADEACMADNTKMLPLGTEWEFGRQATRQRNSATLVATAASRNFVLHYESGGWKLEEFTSGKADAMWATKDGGLWVRGCPVLRPRARGLLSQLPRARAHAPRRPAPRRPQSRAARGRVHRLSRRPQRSRVGAHRRRW